MMVSGLGDVDTRTCEGAPLPAQRMALRAAVFVALFVPLEGAAGQRTVRALSLVHTGMCGSICFSSTNQTVRDGYSSFAE